MPTGLFRVLPVGSRVPTDARLACFLVRDNWDDYKFKTSLDMVVVDEQGDQFFLGSVKVAEMTYEPGRGSIPLPADFDVLPGGYFSLGQSETYYETLAKLGPGWTSLILNGLHDIVADNDLFHRVRNLPVSQKSLFRQVSPATVRGKFARILTGDAPLTPYKLKYDDLASYTLDFEVEPESRPPSNIHVLIGRNGVGKTRLLSRMAHAIMDADVAPEIGGRFTSLDSEGHDNSEGFAGLALVSFSAFDTFNPPPAWSESTEPRFSYIGLKRRLDRERTEVSPTSETSAEISIMTPDELTASFSESVKAVLQTKRNLWVRALEHLESDPVFAGMDVSALATDKTLSPRETFKAMSSGHKIVLLTITKLVEQVEERTLVLIDEPEAHLHPPLLAALVRSLSDLLIRRNGVAVVATHSPVVLQEVPSQCVWMLRRAGRMSIADRPETETFGENVGTLTHEVFGLEVTNSGFYKLLTEASLSAENYQEALDLFTRKVGGEGRALLRSMSADELRS